MTDDQVAAEERDLPRRLRREYEEQGLVEEAMADDPFAQFAEWHTGVRSAGLAEPDTFVLATATTDGRPSARAVLMKDISPDGLVFYTNLESRKSNELKANPHAAATFVWAALHRQIRFEGRVSEVSDAIADSYFATRPRGAQIAAHASNQSQPVDTRQELDDRYSALEEGFMDKEIARPPSWGGWRLQVESAEFWQGQPNRFHDRVRYSRVGDTWSKERLAP